MDKRTSTFGKLYTDQTSDVTSSSNSSENSFGLSEQSILGTMQRSKSLSCISPNNFSHTDVRRIFERLLRTHGNVEASAIKNFSRSQILTLISLASVDFMSFCSTSIMAPFFPKEANEKGMSESLTGLVFSFYALVMFISSPVFGKIIPKFGAKFLFLLGIFVAGICYILFGFLEYVEDNAVFTILCILVQGMGALGASAYSTASYVFVINYFPNNIGSVIGILETFVGLGMSMGPVVGGLLYSLGGFRLPFFVVGVAMVIIASINVLLLPNIEDCSILTNKTTSIFKLIQIPAVVLKGLVIIVVSNVWSFLDPTLEPHLRNYNLSPEQVGLVFLLMAALYGISSPVWGLVADKADNHWSMMVVGLFSCSIGLILLGPCPFIPFLHQTLWTDLLALSIIGVSVALALLPTFQGILTSATKAGHSDTLATYSLVAGIWSCMYSLGDFLGPGIGGCLLEKFGFPIVSTVMAMVTFLMAIITTVFFLFQSSERMDRENEYNESWRSSNITLSNENTPLLLSTIDPGCQMYKEQKQYYTQNGRYDEYTDLSEKIKSSISVSITGKGSSEI